MDRQSDQRPGEEARQAWAVQEAGGALALAPATLLDADNRVALHNILCFGLGMMGCDRLTHARFSAESRVDTKNPAFAAPGFVSVTATGPWWAGSDDALTGANYASPSHCQVPLRTSHNEVFICPLGMLLTSKTGA